jgi:hypothetical protein
VSEHVPDGHDQSVAPVQTEKAGKQEHSTSDEHGRFAVGMQMPASVPPAYTQLSEGVVVGQGVPANPPHIAVQPVTYEPPT